MESFKESYIKKCQNTPEIGNKVLPMGELVDLCRTVYPHSSDLSLLSKMRIKTTSRCCSGYLATQSLNDMWLVFYMASKYNKMWIEGDNKWVKSKEA